MKCKFHKLCSLYQKFSKINSTVSPLNWGENLSNFIRIINPIRWKVFEVHLLKGINDNFFIEFGDLKPWQFQSFIERLIFSNLQNPPTISLWHLKY